MTTIDEKKERAELMSQGLQAGYPDGSTTVDAGFATDIPIADKEEIANPPVEHTVNVVTGQEGKE